MSHTLLIQLIALLVYAVDYNVDLHHGNWEIQSQWLRRIPFVFYHGLLFGWINYVLVPRLLYPRRYLWFALALIGSLTVWMVGEELGLERLLFFEGRGQNSVRPIDLYYFYNEVGFPLLGFLAIKMYLDHESNRRRLEAIERERLSDELKLLRAQVQPHVLFNSLNNLYEFTLHRTEAAPELVLRLSNVLRYVLYETTEEQVPLSQEIAFLEDYIALQSFQLEGRGEATFTITGESDTWQLAPFLLIPFVENAFKHALATLPVGIVIAVDLKVSSDLLQLEVTNNYRRRESELSDLTRSGIGLANVRKRLDLLYPNTHRLDIRDKKAIFKVHLSISRR